jgi:hypothetical protein
LGGGGGGGTLFLQQPSLIRSVFSCFVYGKNPSMGWSGLMLSRIWGAKS